MSKVKLIINTKRKKVYIFEIIFLILLCVLIILSVFYFLISPESKKIKDRDIQRESEINKILTSLENYINNDEGASGFLSNVKLCADGWSEIGEADNQINLSSVLGYKITPDPKAPSGKVGYDICRSYDGYRFQLRAPYAEEKQIIMTKRFTPKATEQ